MNETEQPITSQPVNRRNFLKTASTAVVGGSLLGCASIERSAHVAPNDELKLALIGCGGRGSGAADQALSTTGKIKLVAMADVFDHRLQSSLKNLKKLHGDKVQVPEDQQFIGFDAYKKGIAMADVVILSTPPGFRPIHFEEAVNQGKHIFMEKPVAVDAPGIRRVMAAAQLSREKNLKVAVGFQRHHQKMYLETMQRLHDGAIGDLVSMRIYWNGNRPWQHPRKPGMSEMQFQMDNWYYFTWLCGDHIVEQHIHNIDVANWIKQGHPIRANGMGGCQKPRKSDDGEIFDHHAVEFEYADGSHCSSQCRHILGCWDDVSEHVQGTKGTLDIADHRGSIIKGHRPWTFDGSIKQKNPYQVEHDDFWAAIREGKHYNEADYGITSTMTAILGRMATYSGKVINWDDAINSTVSLAPDTYSWDATPKSAIGPDGLYPMPIPGDPEWLKKIV